MSNRISRIQNDVQDRSSEAWQRLCEYIDQLAESGEEIFAPYEVLGNEFYFQIHTLPESISRLKKVKQVWLYGSNLKRIPPEIGEMVSLEYFDPYKSHNLYWLPYEITNCKNLVDSRVSTRVLYGNCMNRKGFPRLDHNPVKYYGDQVKCSVCKKEITYGENNQFWLTLEVGTDDLPLLVNLCSDECYHKLPQPTHGYVKEAHKGGAKLVQPVSYNMEYGSPELPRYPKKPAEEHNIYKNSDRLWRIIDGVCEYRWKNR